MMLALRSPASGGIVTNLRLRRLRLRLRRRRPLSDSRRPFRGYAARRERLSRLQGEVDAPGREWAWLIASLLWEEACRPEKIC